MDPLFAFPHKITIIPSFFKWKMTFFPGSLEGFTRVGLMSGTTLRVRNGFNSESEE
jgi:hypothetical protein